MQHYWSTNKPIGRHKGRRRHTWCRRLAVVVGLASLQVPVVWSPAAAIVNGSPVPASPLNHATVAIGLFPSFCTGTLVAADLVLTAGHCVGVRWRPAVPPVGVARFRSAFDWERPDRFYRLTNSLPILVGTRTAAPVFSATATEYAAPGLTDMILLRLARPVPAASATPVRIATSVAHRADPSAWLRALMLQVAGFGDTNDADNVDVNPRDGVPDWTMSPVLMGGTADRAVFPCPATGGGWTFPGSYVTCVESADGSGTRGGDSGGPLYWTDSAGTRHLMGVYQGMERANGGRYLTPFYRGGSGYDRNPYPNLGDWLERMVLGREGGDAFAWKSQPAAGDEYVNQTYSASPTGRQAHVTHRSVGDYRVRFEGLRHAAEGPKRVPFVTAYGTDAGWCKLLDTSRADDVGVSCFTFAGSPVDTRFSLLSADNPQDLLISVPRLAKTRAGLTRASATIRRAGLGLYDVTAPVSPGGAWRNVIVTAVGADRTRCHVQSWSSGSARVQCNDHTGTARDTAFNLGVTRGTDSSYADANRPTGTSYTVPRSRANIAASGSLPTIRRTSFGVYTVSFAGAPRNVGGNVQVNARGTTTNHCKVASWGPDSAAVHCFDRAGRRADTAFTIRYVDPLDIGRRVTVQLNELRATSLDSCGGMDIYGNLHFLSGASGSVTIPKVNDADVRRLSPPIGLTAITNPGTRYVDVRLDLRDDDDVLCGGGDDVIDVVAHPAVQDLRFRIDLQANTVQMLDAVYPTIGGLGNWWSDGRDGVETGKVDFSVSVRRPGT